MTPTPAGRRRANRGCVGVAAQHAVAAKTPGELTECIGNWKAAEAEPETVSALLEKEIANGWVIRTSMST